jgi:thiamine biosynthesis lipoprotein
MRNSMDRRNFLKGLGTLSLGSAVFTLALPKGSWAAAVANDAYKTSLLSMGTLVNVTILGEERKKASEAARDALAEIQRIDDLMSTHRRFSMLSRVNEAAGNDMVAVDPRIAEVIEASLEWSRQSGGVFDVTILPLLRAWGFRPEDRNVPESVEAAIECVGYKQIGIEDGQIGLARKNAAIDVGGIAKGYAVDRAIAVLRDKWNIGSAIVEAGGDLYALGRPVDEPGWKIGVRNPATGHDYCAAFDLADQAVATSGAREERASRDGRSYGDMFNPYTGQPVETYLSTTACAATAMDADAASTTLFIAGRDAGAEIVRPSTSWLHIDRDGAGLALLPSQGFPRVDQI